MLSWQPRRLPKGSLGGAINHALNQWDALWGFSLGWPIFLFGGNSAAGENLARLYSLIATCEANEIKSVECLVLKPASGQRPRPGGPLP